MAPGTAAFIIIIVAMVMVTAIITTWMQTRSSARVKEADEAESGTQRLVAENDRLRGEVGRLEARVAVLERIATDPAERTAREIEGLR